MLSILVGFYLTGYGVWLLFKYSYYELMYDKMEPIMMKLIEKKRIYSRHNMRYQYVYRYTYKNKEKTFILKSYAKKFVGETDIFLIDHIFGIVFVDENTHMENLLFGMTSLLCGIGILISIILKI